MCCRHSVDLGDVLAFAYIVEHDFLIGKCDGDYMQALSLEEDGLHCSDGGWLCHIPHSISFCRKDAQRLVHAGDVNIGANARQANRV